MLLPNQLIAFILFVHIDCVFMTSYEHGDRCMYIDYRGKDEKKDNESCPPKTDICRQNFTITHIYLPPYSTSHILESMIRKCCGPCVSITDGSLFLNISEITFSKVNSSDFIFPFLAKSSAVSLYGYHFVPIIDVPTIFYFTPRYRSLIGQLVVDCLKLYPLIVVSLLMAVISGFVVWSLETWSNEEEFPRQFLSGLFEGFWWSFVSMTTVGYGDRNVKSTPARIFSVFWILIGITLFGLTTSLITVEMMKALQPLVNDMTGSKVGVLRYRDYDASLVVKHGGIVAEAPSWNFYSDILLLIGMLRREEINGFVIDKYTLAYTIDYFAWKETNSDSLITMNRTNTEDYSVRKDDIDFFRNYTDRTLKEYKGDELAYGALIRDTDVYQYFRDAIRDNRLPFDTYIGSNMNQLFPRKTYTNIFSASSEYFLDSVFVLAGILLTICMFGLVYELYKRKVFWCRKANRYDVEQICLERMSTEIWET